VGVGGEDLLEALDEEAALLLVPPAHVACNTHGQGGYRVGRC